MKPWFYNLLFHCFNMIRTVGSIIHTYIKFNELKYICVIKQDNIIPKGDKEMSDQSADMGKGKNVKCFTC